MARSGAGQTDPRSVMTATPLAETRVLDLSNFLAGPLAAMFMADFGANVIKVEQPGEGDELRKWGESKDGVGLYYKVINRGKRSVTLDLRTPFGVDAVKRLVRDIDILVENFRPGTLEKWGLGYDVLSAINPGLIMLRISGFGQTGPYSSRPGFGTLAEAYAGYAHITGYPDKEPLLPGFGLADSTTGLMGAYVAIVALHEKRRSGRGQVIDLAIYETLLTLLGPQVVNFDQLGIIQGRNGSRLPFTAPRNTYRTKDGKWVSIAGSAQSTFERICAALDVPELVADSRFADNRCRLAHAKELDDALQQEIKKLQFADLLARFLEHNATVAPVNDVAQLFQDAHIAARENIVSLEDAELGQSLRMQNVVGKLSKTPGFIRSTGPRLGEHNREILIAELGYSERELNIAGLVVDSAADSEAGCKINESAASYSRQTDNKPTVSHGN
jgi:crotonobetainyl-CoA:carnitine CoA-transferase CaiB-like acyl-CoA transferase